MTPLREQPTLRSWLAWLALGIVVWALAAHLRTLFTIAGVLFAALMLSVAIRPLAVILSRRRIPIGVTVVGVYLALAGILTLVGMLVAPIVTTEIGHLRDTAPIFMERAYNAIMRSPELRQAMPNDGAIIQGFAHRLDAIAGRVPATAAKVGHALVNVLIVIVLAYFFTTDPGGPDRLIHAWVPADRRDQARALAGRISRRLSHWIWAQALICVYFAVAYGTALVLLGIPYGITIAIVGGLLEIIPYVGSGTALVLSVLSALTVAPIHALWVVLVFTVIVQVKAHIIEPKLYGRALGLHPAAVIVALLIGGEAAGIIGLLFSVPVAAVIATVLEEIQISRTAWRNAPAVAEGAAVQPGEPQAPVARRRRRAG